MKNRFEIDSKQIFKRLKKDHFWSPFLSQKESTCPSYTAANFPLPNRRSIVMLIAETSKSGGKIKKEKRKKERKEEKEEEK